MNEAWYSSSLRSSNRSPMSCWRPNTVTSSWPVKDSSICPFSCPVCRHWAVNSFWDLVPMIPITTPDSGRAISAISASCQESQNIMKMMPMMVSTEYTRVAKACCMADCTLSTSLVVRESRSPRWRVSK